MKKPVLVLNKNWFPINAQKSFSDVFIGICSGAFKPVDVTYVVDENCQVNLDSIESLNVVESIQAWGNIEVRPYDEYVTTPNRIYRMPPIVVCANFKDILKKKMQFPTKSNIWKRDNYTCGYSGEKLTRETISCDHILPSSRGGLNSWENLITCSKLINGQKGNKTPKEAGLKLLWQPKKPADGYSFDFMRKEWEMFLDGGRFE